nr:transmembrane protein 215 [Anolis sagrei ordinatus]
MRPDDINPRTGLVVALVSVFLVFGFMFTVSGIKGETLGDIPLLAIGPAICLPGIAAIALARKTDGCTKWPDQQQQRGGPPGHGCCPCRRKKARDKDALELLRTPSDLESGRGSCDELAVKAASSSSSSLPQDQGLAEAPKVDQEEMLRYLENCYPEMPGNVFVAEGSPFRALEKPRESPVLEAGAAASAPLPPSPSPSSSPAATADTEVNIFVAPSDNIIVCSYKETSPYDRYCCYVNPSEEICSDHEAVV